MTRMVTVLRQGAQRNKHTGQYDVWDYIAKPAIDVNGVWDIKDLIPGDQMAALAAWANRYEKNKVNSFQRITGRKP